MSNIGKNIKILTLRWKGRFQDNNQNCIRWYSSHNGYNVVHMLECTTTNQK